MVETRKNQFQKLRKNIEELILKLSMYLTNYKLQTIGESWL